MFKRSARKLVLAIGTLLLGWIIFVHAGTWLVVEDPLEKAPVEIVLGGKTPFRAMEAAEIYKEGWTREIWLTESKLGRGDIELSKLGVQETQEETYNRHVLVRLGVPDKAILLIKGRNNNTADEVKTVTRELRRRNIHRAIVVTSSYHTRRVKMIWGLYAKDVTSIVRLAPQESFNIKDWWRDAGDAWAVLHEWFGLLNAWAGFPIKSEHW